VSGIYVASKAFRGPMWRALRDNGLPICSTWIDESEPGQTFDWEGLWLRCLREVREADALVLYWEGGDVLKGALVEVGVALASNVHVLWVGPRLSVCAHPLVLVVETLPGAMAMANSWAIRNHA